MAVQTNLEQVKIKIESLQGRIDVINTLIAELGAVGLIVHIVPHGEPIMSCHAHVGTCYHKACYKVELAIVHAG
jgi:hypothetical protein